MEWNTGILISANNFFRKTWNCLLCICSRR